MYVYTILSGQPSQVRMAFSFRLIEDRSIKFSRLKPSSNCFWPSIMNGRPEYNGSTKDSCLSFKTLIYILKHQPVVTC